ncbi:MAG: cobalamin-dependent protein [Candidatus Adiutrix sp.]|nr:cobalamin-dependent protein [Candidatus Adiutrix sp.]
MKRLHDLVVAVKEAPTLTLVADLLHQGVDPKIILDSLSEGLTEIGRRYEAQEYYMASLLLGGDLLRQALQILLPHLLRNPQTTERKGLVLIGAIEGDIHDLGKNTAGHFLKANGFEVIDLGADVAPKTFLQETLKRNPDFIGVSLLLTTCVPALKRLANILEETYQGQLNAPILFAACGFLKHQQDALAENRKKSKDRFGVENIVIDIKETVQFCQNRQREKLQHSIPDQDDF